MIMFFVALLYFLVFEKRKSLKILVLLFPFSFWFGDVEAWHANGFIKPCSGANGVCDKSTDRDYLEQFFMCRELNGKLIKEHMDKMIKTVQEDGPTTVTSEVKDDGTEKLKRNYHTEVPIYPCKKIKIEKANGETDWVVVHDVDEDVNFEILNFYIPTEIRTYSEEMTCGHVICSEHIGELNDQTCKHKCLENLGCDPGSWRDNECYKYPFWHLFVSNANKNDLKYYNTPYNYRCNLNQHSCWNPIFNVYGLSNREQMNLDTLINSKFQWHFMLLKLNEIKLSYDIVVYSANEMSKYNIDTDEINFSMDDGKFRVKTKRDKNGSHKLLLVGFRNDDIGVFSDHVYHVKDEQSVNDFFKIGFKNIPKDGFLTGWKKYQNSIVSMDMSFDKVNKLLENKFKKLTKNELIGYAIVKKENKFEKSPCIEKTILDNLRENFKDKKEIEAPNCEYITPSIIVFRHEASYGTMELEVEMDQPFKRQEQYMEKVEVTLSECKGSNYEIGGYSVKIKRHESGEGIAIFECISGGSHCGTLWITHEASEKIVRFTSSLIGKHSFKQIKPYLKEENIISVECVLSNNNWTLDDIGAHARSGYVPPDLSNLRTFWTDFKEHIYNFGSYVNSWLGLVKIFGLGLVISFFLIFLKIVIIK